MKFLVLAFIFRMNYNPYGDHLNYHLALQFGLFFFICPILWFFVLSGKMKLLSASATLCLVPISEC